MSYTHVAHLRIDLQPVHPEITLNELIARIVERIPGARIIDEDWYAYRRSETERVHARRGQEGRPLSGLDEILASTDRAAAGCGPAKLIAVRVGGSNSLVGRISRQCILVFSDVPIDQMMADRLLTVLGPLGVVKGFRIFNKNTPGKAPKHG
jgi:hypothetical protein